MMHEDDKKQIINNNNMFNNNSEVTDSVLEKIGKDPLNIDDLIEAIKLISNGGRLSRIDKNTFFNIIGISMFGTAIKPNLLIAPEHIPTFISMIYIAANNRLYSKTNIGSIMKTYAKHIETKDFVKTVTNILREELK
jgi:uncharacterized protein (DUF1697 family)